MDLDGTLARAAEALAAGRWEEARDGFRAALAGGERGDALFGLADALFWLADADGCLTALEQAYAAQRREGADADAALTAIWLSALHLKMAGNRPACQGWLARGARLVDAAGVEALRGWVSLARSFAATAPDRALALTEDALAAARDGGDRDLELCALGRLGAVLTASGRLDEGLAVVDEAMAATLAGDWESRDTVVTTTCSMIEACDNASDLARIRDWCRLADDFMSTFGCPFLYADCRTRYGNVLLATGRWDEAERELATAARTAPAGCDYHLRAVGSLARLRVDQGRLEEAEVLLAPLPDVGTLLVVRSALHHARGAHAVAADLLARHADGPVDEGPGVVAALALWVEVELARGGIDPACAAAGALEARAAVRADRRTAGHAALAAGRVAAAEGDVAAAESALARAIDRFAGAGMPYEAARARLDLAILNAATRPESAALDAAAAADVLERLGAAPAAGAAAALARRLGAPARTGPRDLGVLTRREREVLVLLAAGLSNAEIAQRLVISPKTASHHVSNVLGKLGLRTRAAAAAHAARGLSAGAP